MIKLHSVALVSCYTATPPCAMNTVLLCMQSRCPVPSSSRCNRSRSSAKIGSFWPIDQHAPINVVEEAHTCSYCIYSLCIPPTQQRIFLVCENVRQYQSVAILLYTSHQSKQGRPPQESEKGAVRCGRRASSHLVKSCFSPLSQVCYCQFFLIFRPLYLRNTILILSLLPHLQTLVYT